MVTTLACRHLIIRPRPPPSADGIKLDGCGVAMRTATEKHEGRGMPARQHLDEARPCGAIRRSIRSPSLVRMQS